MTDYIPNDLQNQDIGWDDGLQNDSDFTVVQS